MMRPIQHQPLDPLVPRRSGQLQQAWPDQVAVVACTADPGREVLLLVVGSSRLAKWPIPDS